MSHNPEKERTYLARTHVGWKHWGPYMTERQWGTVREDYSADGSAWNYFPHDDARSRTYRWGEDGIHGWCDTGQYLCFGLGLWNEKDPILKERLFGVTGIQGNHGEDVKEYYYYLDSTPTHSYVKQLYKYPQGEYPYLKIIHENEMRGRKEPEYNLIDTGLFDKDLYFDVFTEFFKAEEEDILFKITAENRGGLDAPIHILPQLWFRNIWAWTDGSYKPQISKDSANSFLIEHKDLGTYHLYFEGNPETLFCENDTNHARVYGHKPTPGYWKDGINDYVITGNISKVNPAETGTKSALHYKDTVPAYGKTVIKLRLSNKVLQNPFEDYDEICAERLQECETFYEELQKKIDVQDIRDIQRQAFAGMLTTKQFYYFDVNLWLKGDAHGAPPVERLEGRNKEWTHLNNMEIISMPDKWEYPWYAAWDLAFHTIPLAVVDPDFAKRQLLLLLREWYMHPNGQIPAYEWSFSDVNPPVHAWATWRVYEIERDTHGHADFNFLERIFHKLLINFTWWVNRKDSEGNNIFSGGFLGLDNIGVFDRSQPLPTGGRLEQADATSWMAMYSLNMLRISLELAKVNSAYEDTASKFLEHFLYIAGAVGNLYGSVLDLWDNEDGFFYDVLNMNNGHFTHLKVRSMVGIIPLFAVETLEADFIDDFPHFKRRMEWFLKFRPEFNALISTRAVDEHRVRRRFSLLREGRLKRMLTKILDETEFLSDYGIRALSKYHLEHPYEFKTETETLSVKYNPSESDSGMFGGNSNWRGPIWFPLNYLIIESLMKYYHYYRDEVKVEYPTGSGNMMNLKQIAEELSQRLLKIFMKRPDGTRPVFDDNEKISKDPHFKDNILFYEYFHGDSGVGLGANHQTGWTGLIAELIHYHYHPKEEPTKRI